MPVPANPDAIPVANGLIVEPSVPRELEAVGVDVVQFDEPSLSEIVYSAQTAGTFY